MSHLKRIAVPRCLPCCRVDGLNFAICVVSAINHWHISPLLQQPVGWLARWHHGEDVLIVERPEWPYIPEWESGSEKVLGYKGIAGKHTHARLSHRCV